jgi:hypothetical protein
MRSKAVVVVFLVLAVLTIPTVSADAPVHQVSGGGALMSDAFDTSESYGFVAQIDSEGVVSGQGSFRASDFGVLHFEVNCLAVEGNIAWLGGVITKSPDPVQVPVGLDFTWQLQDNGEGEGAAPDLQSFVIPNDLLPIYGLGNDCNDMGPLFLLGVFEWDRGNLQVR